MGVLQQYPPGTQENYNRFSSKNSITEKGKESEYPEGAGGGKGEPGVPPSVLNVQRCKYTDIKCSQNHSNFLRTL